MPTNSTPTPDETARPTPSERIAEIQRNSYWNSLPQLATSASIVSSQLAIKHIVELETAIAREKERADDLNEAVAGWKTAAELAVRRAEAAETRLAALRVHSDAMANFITWCLAGADNREEGDEVRRIEAIRKVRNAYRAFVAAEEGKP